MHLWLILFCKRSLLLTKTYTELFISPYVGRLDISQGYVAGIPGYETSQEKADAKVALHAMKILKGNTTAMVTIRSHAGYTDILVLYIGLFGLIDTVIMFDGNVNNKKSICYSMLILMRQKLVQQFFFMLSLESLEDYLWLT